jgi:hypothetical protein
MKPRMRAFSGRVILLAVLNISWAANICSLCEGQEVGVEATCLYLPTGPTGFSNPMACKLHWGYLP